MRLPEFSIKNHQFTIIIISLLTLFGIVSFFTMPRSEDPQVSPAGTSIIIVFPGANPADLEELVVDPIEEVVNELEDIKHINTKAEDGLALIQVEFLAGSDPDDKYSDVVQKVNSIRNDLPDEILRLETMKWTITDVKILQVALVSEKAPYSVLEKEAERLETQFKRVSGVFKADIRAYPEQEIRISLDIERMAALNLPLNRVIGAVQSNNANIPGGSIDIGKKRFNIKTSGSYENIEQIRNTVIDAAAGKVVYLKDIADVNYSYEDEKYIARFNGKKAVFVTASQKKGTNIYNVYEGLTQKVEELRKELPADISLETVFDQTESVSFRLNGFFLNLVEGLALVGIVVLLAVGFRASLIVMLVIPVSILIAIGGLDSTNFGIEQMSIAGLVIALGLLVDNAIVVTENITRFNALGYKRTEAAIKATAQIGWAVVSSTVTTVLAFVPIIMMQNITGDFIRSMPATVVYTLIASLFISLSLTPYLSSKFLAVNGKRKTSKVQTKLSSFISGPYRKILDFALSRPALIVISAVVIFLLSTSLFPLIGVSFFPKAEKPQFLINVELPEGNSFDRTNEVVNYVENILSESDQVRSYAANVGRGNPRIYYNQFSKFEKNNYGQVLVELESRDHETNKKLVSSLREKFALFPGAKIEIKEFEQGPPVQAPIELKIIGENLDELKRIASDVEGIVAGFPGAININNPLKTSKTDLHVEINRERAQMLGAPVYEIDKTVRAAIAGMNISRFRDPDGKEYNIVIRLPFENKPEMKDFDKIYINSVTGAAIPLKQLAEIKFQGSPMQINHYNLERNVPVTADVESGYEASALTEKIINELEKYEWPRGYRYYAAGELEKRDESFGGMFQALIIAIVGIFGVLVLQFRSYSQPLIVFSALPLAFIGSFVALFLSGNSFSFTAFVGLTSLVGIVVNNSIILVDYTNQLRKEGTKIPEALKEAAETRFLPIILTTGTTIGGLLPLTLAGGTMWAPMGWTIIGGLLSSTFLTLIVVPVLYKLYSKKELES